MSQDSIQELIKAEARKLVNVDFEPSESMYKLGAVLFIRTVTYHYIGRVTFLGDKTLRLEDASWVADSGRFGEALRNGTLSETEPYPDGGTEINRDTIVDASLWNHELPTEAK